MKFNIYVNRDNINEKYFVLYFRVKVVEMTYCIIRKVPVIKVIIKK